MGATAVIWQTRRGAARHPSDWVLALLERRPAKLVVVALANKIARIAWKLMVSGESFARDVTRDLKGTSGDPIGPHAVA